jgi:hypothetical protein
MTDTETTRRFGWYVPKPGGKVDIGRHTKPFPKESWAEFQRIVAVTADLRPFVIDYLALENDFAVLDAIEDELATYLDAMPNAFAFTGVGQTAALSKAQGAVSNYLSAASAFRDRAITRLRRRYSDGSLELKMLNAAIQDAYDSSFAYRLLYNLRNYGQHHDTPLSMIPVEGARQASGEMKFRVSLVLNPSELLDSNLVQPSFRRKELAHHVGQIELLPLAREFLQLHGVMMRTIIDAHVGRLVEMQEYGRLIYAKMKLPKGAIPVIWEEERPDSCFHLFSFDELAFLNRLHGRLSGREMADSS